MIFGSFGKGRSATFSQQSVLKKWRFAAEPAAGQQFHLARNFAVGVLSSGAPSHDAGHFLHVDPDAGVTIALYGNLFNLRDLAVEFTSDAKSALADGAGSILFAAYRKLGLEVFQRLNGNFILVIHDQKNDRLWIARDHLGIESLFFYRQGDKLHFSSDLHQLANHQEVEKKLNPTAILRYFLFNYNPAFDTFYENIQKLRPGYVLRIEKGKMIISAFWFISFRQPHSKTIGQYREELLELLNDAIRIRLRAGPFRAGAYLSGGMDSSTVVGMMRPMVEGPLHTFSFRCRGKGFDESEYARLMSERYQTEHHEIPYEPDDVDKILHIAGLAQEPFSDIGIEVGSYLLAEQAAGVVDYVLTGDGGDELFAGHPVYLADRIAARFEKIPAIFRRPMTGLLQFLPDTDQKKSLAVKLKRFSYSSKFPADLYSNRWRLYYGEAELQQLLSAEWRELARGADPLEEIRSLYLEADGQDHLSKTLYGDYFTVVGFYLRRMELVRHFGLEGRFPLFDPRLVEYAARIPSELKIGKNGETKLILHQVMDGVLPDEIVHRKDKLGHSVPFKNWLRDAPRVRELLRDNLAPAMLARRGIFNAAFVDRLLARHLDRRDNNSHRLWALLVFELWCQTHLDAREQPAVPATQVS